MGKTVQSIELERLYQVPNNRFPYIILYGPRLANALDEQTYKVTDHDILYEIRLYDKINDESISSNTEITYIMRNVYADITQAVMVDKTRGGLAQTTKLLDFEIVLEEMDDGLEAYQSALYAVKALIDSDDPYQLA